MQNFSIDKKQIFKRANFEQLAPYLRLPSKMTIAETRKQLAETGVQPPQLSTALNTVLKVIYPGLTDIVQIQKKIVYENLGRKIDQIEFVYSEDKIIGHRIQKDDGRWLVITQEVKSSVFSSDYKVENLIAICRSYFKNSANDDVFLNQLKAALRIIGKSVYTLPKNKSLDDVTDKSEIKISVEKLIDCSFECSSIQVLRYALAAIYNDHATACALKSTLLKQIEQNGEIKLLKEADWDTPSLNTKYLFGATCYALDSDYKKILCDLMVNYSGW